ncbi:GTP pyrophosphokinase [Criibacterium bergeronii]|uniref:GTP pyrophosphokinase family protein n=1 Tax=Criibacterium bergeronii TaxID=1871336 RepID=A0A371IJY8_9FIRM|nr:GTP pyrophosphokinase family protein [Criibacterium bergeronii]MBS6063333.1 GTP pyrophosphokinase family protein [Peptostreptococcaceae bacterium]RDY20807.1 GTP pyrophosphokinase family protein [Criibacterium bergeronii]
MDVFSWKDFLISYEFAVEELKIKFKNIRNELKDHDSYSPIEFVTGRVKKISSIIEKANRLDVPLTKEDIETKIEDIAGIRIMCQFVDDIYTVADLIKSRSDMKVAYEKDYIKNSKKSGYRSYHIVVKYPVQTVTGVKNILAEIQIRTLAMNFWATIEHSLKYKYDHLLPDDLSQKLRNAADSAFMLDNEMSEIRDEIVGAQIAFEVKSGSVKDIMSSISYLYMAGYSDEASSYIKKFDKIKNIMDIKEVTDLQNDIQLRIREINSDKKSTTTMPNIETIDINKHTKN